MTNKTCETCTAWSQLMAEGRPSGVAAICLNPQSPRHSKWCYGSDKCEKWSDDLALSDLRYMTND